MLDWPVLGTLWQAAPEEDIINPMGYNSNVESYGILRTNIGFTAIDKPLHTLVVTSSNPGEGKSVVAANLAIFMAKSGKNTLLIDANLRRPTLHEHFGIPAHAMGFSNAVLMFSMLTTTNALFTPKTETETSSTSVATSKESISPFVRTGNIPNLYVMPSGPLPPNPPELLDSKAMQGLFAALSNCGAEVVIFDTPPLLGLSDTSILASKVDSTLVVVDAARTSKGNLKQAKALLEQAGVCVVGSVVNKRRRGRKNTPYSYNYGAGKQSRRDSHSREDRNLRDSYSYGAGKQTGRNDYSREIRELPAISPVTSAASKQPGTASRPEQEEPRVSKQPGTASRPEQEEPRVSKQPGTASQPKQEEPRVSKQPGTASQPKQEEPHGGANGGTNNIDSPAVPSTTDQTMKLPVEAVRSASGVLEGRNHDKK